MCKQEHFNRKICATMGAEVFFIRLIKIGLLETST